MRDEPGHRLRELLDARRAVLVPGAANALAGRIIEDIGFDAVYLTGAGVTNTFYGIPDLAFVGVSDIAEHTAALRDVVSLPIIVDADTGFGNALNVMYTVRRLERAGANAIQIEDQASPKKCGHFSGKGLIPSAEMAAKVMAAVDARANENFLVVARTDARAVEGMDAALERAHRYLDAGADVTFVEAPESVDEMQRIASELPVPQIVNMVVGGKTPIVGRPALERMGFGLVLYANAALQAAVLGMQRALGALQANGALDEAPDLLASFDERQRIVDKSRFDALSERYSDPPRADVRMKADSADSTDDPSMRTSAAEGEL